MKTKLIGLGILAAVVVAAIAYVFVTGSQKVTELSGFVGGEKIGFLEDGEVREILKDKYKLSIDYAKAGSIDMVTGDADGRDFLFPSVFLWTNHPPGGHSPCGGRTITPI